MKKIYLTVLAAVILLNICKAQWNSLGTGIQAPPRGIWSISAPNEDVVWAICYDINNIDDPTSEFTRSTDGGITWMSGVLDIDTFQVPQYIYALDDQTAWLAVFGSLDGIFSGGTIYKTTDGGTTWMNQATAFPGTNDMPHAVYFFNKDEGVAFGGYADSLSQDGIKIFRTLNGGNQWVEVPAPTLVAQEGMDFDVGNGMYDVVGDTIWFVSNKARVFKSSDRGQTWDAYATDLPIPGPSTYSGPCSIAFQDDLNGIVVSYDPSEATRTTDGGLTWNKITDFPTDINTFQIEYIPGTEATYLVHDGFYYDSPRFYVTYDGGEAWELIVADKSMATIKFLSPTLGYGGGDFTDPDSAGIYKWENELLVPTSVEESDYLSLSVSPNPATDFLTIQLPSATSHAVEVDLFDLQGRLMGRQSISVGQSIDLEGLPSGMYWVKTAVDNGIYVGKFVKR